MKVEIRPVRLGMSTTCIGLHMVLLSRLWAQLQFPFPLAHAWCESNLLTILVFIMSHMDKEFAQHGSFLADRDKSETCYKQACVKAPLHAADGHQRHGKAKHFGGQDPFW